MRKKSEAAVLMGQLRWKKKTKAERAAHGRMMRAARAAKEKSLETKRSA